MNIIYSPKFPRICRKPRVKDNVPILMPFIENGSVIKPDFSVSRQFVSGINIAH